MARSSNIMARLSANARATKVQRRRMKMVREGKCVTKVAGVFSNWNKKGKGRPKDGPNQVTASSCISANAIVPAGPERTAEADVAVLQKGNATPRSLLSHSIRKMRYCCQPPAESVAAATYNIGKLQGPCARARMEPCKCPAGLSAGGSGPARQ